MIFVKRPAGVWSAALAALVLCACATTQPKVMSPPIQPRSSGPARPIERLAPSPAPNLPARPVDAPTRSPPQLVSLTQLEGWDSEDHAAALDMFRSSCAVNKDPAWREVCLRARDLGRQDEVIAKAFWETNFRAQPLADEGLLTGYFAPRYPARASRQWPYTAAVRSRPADLPAADVGAGGGTVPYLDREAIEATPPDKALAWMKPEDLFFLQIQGSGVLTFPDGRQLRAVYAANNGLAFVGVAAPMRSQGLLTDNNTSGEMIRAWLGQHRGAEAEAVMRLNPRYIFFTLRPYDGSEPAGAAGVALTPGRALAVDPTRHAYGELYWINGEAPVLTGAFPSYRRLAMALDTGSAIRGEVRADLYLGTGEDAGAEAGRVRHRLKLYRLMPILEPLP